MKKIFLLIILIFVFTSCGENENIFEEEIIFEEPTFATTELTVWGMTCNRCVNKISGALNEIDGIINVSVDLNAELVTVEHDFDLDTEIISQTITGEGFNIPWIF